MVGAESPDVLTMPLTDAVTVTGRVIYTYNNVALPEREFNTLEQLSVDGIDAGVLAFVTPNPKPESLPQTDVILVRIGDSVVMRQANMLGSTSPAGAAETVVPFTAILRMPAQ